MPQKRTPKKATNLRDTLSSEDLSKIQAYKGDSSGTPVDSSWMALTEFAEAFGWEAYIAARDNKISSNEMYTLLECKRKLDALKQYQMAESFLIGAGSVNTKRPHQTFKRLTKYLLNRIKVQE